MHVIDWFRSHLHNPSIAAVSGASARIKLVFLAGKHASQALVVDMRMQMTVFWKLVFTV